MAGKIFIVGTPIGNLGDLTPRMRRAFEESDFVVAEDTRVTVKLLNHFGIKKPLLSYYEHNFSKGDLIIDRVLAGESCAVCSDAGTPCISDPGEILVKQAHRAGIKIVPIPGPSAVITALSVSGQDTGRFTFEGFLSVVKKQRTEHLKDVRYEKRTMIFYEAPHKLLRTLGDFCEYFGRERKLTVARELTKLHEEIKLTTVGEAYDYYSENPPKGEFVLIVEGCKETENEEITIDSLTEKALALIDGGASVSEAAKTVRSGTPFSKSEVYKAIQNQRENRE